MCLLKSFEKGNEYKDIISNTIYILSFNENSVGWFKYIKGVLSAVYVQENSLFFKFGNYCVNVFDIIECSVTYIDDNYSSFTLYDVNRLKINFCYKHNKELYAIEPFDYIDEEDYDWGIFLCNIINDKERTMNIIQNIIKTR
mgnify:FL=1